MNKENTNHILIEVLNNDGDLKLTKFRNPQAIWQNNDYPDEYVFKDVDIVNVFKLIQENKQLKEKLNKISKFIKETSYKNLADRWCFANTKYAQNIIDIIEKGDSNE